MSRLNERGFTASPQAAAQEGRLIGAYRGLGGLTHAVRNSRGGSCPDNWQCRVDTQHVARVAGDDGVPALPGAQRHVHADHVVMAGART
jgi:hypothetical protein